MISRVITTFQHLQQETATSSYSKPHTARWPDHCYCSISWPSPLRSRRCCLLCQVTLPCSALLDWPHVCSPSGGCYHGCPLLSRQHGWPVTLRTYSGPHQPTNTAANCGTDVFTNRATNTCANCKAEPRHQHLYQPLGVPTARLKVHCCLPSVQHNSTLTEACMTQTRAHD
jgi:hypothetical protein